MKSVQISEYGSSDVIKINEISPIPSPLTGKILAEVIAAGVNPVDWKIREGYFRDMMPLRFPSTLGMLCRHHQTDRRRCTFKFQPR
jgi:alcohol dehydrogenase